VSDQEVERRSFPRKPIQARIRLNHSRLGTLEGYSSDISDIGLFIELPILPTIPTGAHIALQMLDSVNPGITFNSRVVRVANDGIGVAIVDYEYNGECYTLDELRRQWHVIKEDVQAIAS
jgi:hypothetical protein